ncbi:MAG TPA: extracellular solute-binding protein [Chloroflexota bacterium]|nr:extracellular solute-binding protein [Chloroflexota bacterium]
MASSDDGQAVLRADGDVSRRRFLRIAGGVAGGTLAMPLLAACVPPAPAVAPTRPAAALPTSMGAANAVYPSYKPYTSGPKPDYPAASSMYDDAFSSYPANPARAFPDAPGSGSTINIMSIQLFPPPTPLDQNPAWQAVNKALNANVNFQIVTSADYPVKLGTVMASNDIPDILYVYARPGAASTLAASAGMPQFLQAQAADLTPYLAGDAAKDYPFLAAIPTTTWKNAGCAYQDKLYLVPIHRYLPGQMLVKNSAVWDKEIGADYVPKSAADFKRILLQLTRPQQDFYGIGGAQDTVMLVPTISSIFGAPNGWRVDASGKLTKDVETAEFKEAVGFVRDLFTAGVFHPNSTTWASAVIARAQFAIGKFAIFRDPINGWQDSWRQALGTSQPFDVRPLPLFPSLPGGKTQHFVTGGHLWASAVKKGSPERTRELLRVLNWLAAPFGSAEHQLLTFGVKGVDYTVDDSGNPTLTQQGNADANYVPWKYVVGAPWVFYTPDLPNYAKVMYDTEHMLLPSAVSDPTFGQVSVTNFTKGFTLTQSLNDAIVDMVVGRRPLSDYEQVVKDWQTNGGETIRKEYQESIAKSA